MTGVQTCALPIFAETIAENCGITYADALARLRNQPAMQAEGKAYKVFHTYFVSLDPQKTTETKFIHGAYVMLNASGSFAQIVGIVENGVTMQLESGPLKWDAASNFVSSWSSNKIEYVSVPSVDKGRHAFRRP